MPDVELRHLRCFLVLAEELSFTSAARRLFVSQQTLSRTVAQLERLVGQDLFARSTRTVRLTAAGAAMLDQARSAVSAADDAVRAAGSAGAAARLSVDVSSAGLQTGGLILRELRARHPEVAVRQVEVGVRQGVDELRAGRLDVVLGLDPRLDDVAAHLVRREPVLVGMSAAHPLAATATVPVVGLAGVPLLLPDDDAAPEWIAFVIDFCRLAGITPVRWPHVTHGSVGAAEVLREGACVTPTCAWIDPPADLVFRPLADPFPVFEWSLLSLRNRKPSRALELFRTCADEVARRSRWRDRVHQGATRGPAALQPQDGQPGGPVLDPVLDPAPGLSAPRAGGPSPG